MKKQKNPKALDMASLKNPVAKYARQFNKAHVFADKNQYRRHAKHRKQEVSLNALFRVFKETFFILRSDYRFINSIFIAFQKLDVLCME